MTVRELIELLQKEDPDRVVVIRDDDQPGCLRYSPVEGVEQGAYSSDWFDPYTESGAFDMANVPALRLVPRP